VTSNGKGFGNNYLVNKYCIPRPLKVVKKTEKERTDGEILY